ncbi:integrase arm-type DNA-binding domain-containing protein [Bartonella krasnovii]|uniref:tyrosine-type recombinase/integrase n=1 Tax=Bartonella krasnovii TaxID=2267275 RepID=UPI001F4C5D30|nr:site-specific integrase [Bartonella krasnovii]UNF37699.1 integrase arm-type DNA-binding domain-containing protein [Bartonella krasnovii]UNF42740.1 integrase arm-type DNA-binding domain-containing protein [Bartonella krasnovii]UNF55950.1 integrase arm-type DNA-binding domain-containing protein [Bartonella krasnovii]
MPLMNRLNARAVATLGAGKYNDGAGLLLHKRKDGGAQWLYRYTIHGRRREMGLGALRNVSLKKARELANQWRSVLHEGRDPIKERDKQKREAISNLHYLKDIALDAFESRKAELKDDGKAGDWFLPLRLYILPKLGCLPVSEITQTEIRNILTPIWHSKAATAEKALNRLNICLKHAAALGLDVDLQVTTKARALLGKQLHKTQNIPAMDWKDVPAFYQTLSKTITMTHLALRLLILTGVRTRPLRYIHKDQIDGDIWTIPAENMKGKRDATTEFRVPLSTEALEILKQARLLSRNDFFFSATGRGPLGENCMSQYMQQIGLEARPHGFRSSLRNWLAETTDAPYEVAETILSHTVGGKVERAYRRTDYLEQRRVYMDKWAAYVTGQA